MRFSEILQVGELVGSDPKTFNVATTFFHADEPETAVRVTVAAENKQLLDLCCGEFGQERVPAPDPSTPMTALGTRGFVLEKSSPLGRGFR